MPSKLPGNKSQKHRRRKVSKTNAGFRVRPQVEALEERVVPDHSVWHTLVELDPGTGLKSESVGEHGRVLYRLGAQIMADRAILHGVEGEKLPDFFIDALRDGIGEEFATTASKTNFYWGVPPLNEDHIDIWPRHEGSEAQTFGYRVYMNEPKPEPGYEYDFVTTTLIIHELVHVVQFERFVHSLSNFGYEYFKDWAQAGLVYRDIDLEEEAFDFSYEHNEAVYEFLWPDFTIDVSGIDLEQKDSDTQLLTWDFPDRRYEHNKAVSQLKKKNADGTFGDNLLPNNHSLSGDFPFDDLGVGTYKINIWGQTKRDWSWEREYGKLIYFPDEWELDANGLPQQDSDGNLIHPKDPSQIRIVGTAPRDTEFTVVDDDTTPPKVIINGPLRAPDSELRTVSWNVTDESGVDLSSLQVAFTKADGTVIQVANPTANDSLDFSTFPLNRDLGYGKFEITITSKDLDRDWEPYTDENTGEVIEDATEGITLHPGFYIYDDDNKDPVISFPWKENETLGETISKEQSHGEDNVIRWEITDDSGVQQVDVQLYRDNILLTEFQASAFDEVNLNPYGPGLFRVVVTAYDGDFDGWEGDQRYATETAYLTVTNDPPTVFAGGPYVIKEGNLLSLTATGNDPDPGDTETLVYHWDLDGDGEFDDAAGRTPVVSWETLTALGVADDGSYSVAVRATDTFGEIDTEVATLTVLNSAPVIESIYSEPFIDENSTLTLTGKFTDAGLLDTHEVVVFWGDGTSSTATVNTDRTFSASHHYADDDPSQTPYDEYIIRVEVTDDDGATNPPQTRTLEVTTNHVGGIKLPSFPLSLPEGVSGLLQSAHVTVDPEPTDTDVVTANPYNHSHVIDYPKVGPFDLPAVTTSSASAADDHTHTFNIPSQSRSYSGSSLQNYQPGTYTLSPRDTILGSSNLPEEYQHVHSTGDVYFTTKTTFGYKTVHASILNRGAELGTRDWTRYRGSATNGQYNTRHFPGRPSGGGSHFFYGGTSSYSSMFQNVSLPSSVHNVIDAGIGRVNLYAQMGGLSGDYARIELEYYSASRSRTGSNSRLTGPNSGGSLSTRQSTFAIPKGTRSITLLLEYFRNFGTYNDGYIDNIGMEIYSFTTTKTIGTWNGYELPASPAPDFLKSVSVTLDAGNETTTSVDVSGVTHDHAFNDFSVGPFQFSQAAFVDEAEGKEAATEDHSHLVDFSPDEQDFTSDSTLRTYFLQESGVILDQPSLTSLTTLGHQHNLENIPFRTTIDFEYDVSATIVRVRNVDPEIVSLDLPDSVEENSTVTLSGEFTEHGDGDTHQVQITWGDGERETLSVPHGARTFTASHLYKDDDPSDTSEDIYQVSVTVLDDDSGTATVTRDITVRNATPTLTVAAADPVAEGSVFTLRQRSSTITACWTPTRP